MLRRDASQVVTYKPDGTQPRWLGTLGHVSGLKYSFTCPGGCDQLSCNLTVDARYRTDALNPGRRVQVIRGASVVWDGKLDEPAPSDQGWQITAHGSGTFGADFQASYSTWASNPDDAVNAAIGRGLRWVNPGIGSPSGIWLGQKQDSASLSITDLLNLATSRGGLTWYVSCRPRGNVLSVFPLPTTATNLLVSSSPVARTLGGDINYIWLRYQSATDSGGTPAAFSLTTVSEAASITAHGQMEAFADLSSAGTQTAAAAQAVGNKVLQRYQRASFAGPFTVGWGQLLTTGGTPVDLGAQQAGGVCRLLLTDYAYGGEIKPDPIKFIVGGYEYDDDAQAAAITPFQSLRHDFASLLGMYVAHERPFPQPSPMVSVPLPRKHHNALWWWRHRHHGWGGV